MFVFTFTGSCKHSFKTFLLHFQIFLTTQEKDARVTFEMFLPMLQDVSSKPIRDTVDDFVEGLKHFDKEGNGLISAVELRHLLTGLGEKMSEEEVEQLIHGKEDSQGNINYEEFVKMVLAQ